MSKNALIVVNVIGIIWIVLLHYLMLNYPYAFSWIIPVVIAANLIMVNVGHAFGKDE